MFYFLDTFRRLRVYRYIDVETINIQFDRPRIPRRGNIALLVGTRTITYGELLSYASGRELRARADDIHYYIYMCVMDSFVFGVVPQTAFIPTARIHCTYL